MVVEVAPAHLDHAFDYRVPEGLEVRPGQRVRVTFAGRRCTGWVVGTAAQLSQGVERARDLHAVQGEHTWFDAGDLRLYRWVAERYAASLADVLRHAMPARVAAVERDAAAWAAGSVAGASAGAGSAAPGDAGRATSGGWDAYGASAMLAALAAPGPAARAGGDRPGPPGAAFWWRPLPGEDVTAMVVDLLGRCLAAGRTALVLAPDPASPLPAAALGAAGAGGADLRLRSDRARYRAFLRCRLGHARVAVGERGAALTPLPGLGLVVVADEASPAYKERRSPRHHAREVALARARMAGAVAVLVGDLPSDRLARLLAEGHVSAVEPDRALERGRSPVVEVVDRSGPDPTVRRGRLAPLAARRVSEALDAGGTAVVVAARGGEGAALACQRCGARRVCPVCDGSVRPRRRPRPGQAAGGPGSAAPGPAPAPDLWPKRSHDSTSATDAAGPGGGAGDGPGAPGAGAGDGPGDGAWECPACRWEGRAFACPECGDGRTAPLAAGAGRLAAELSRSHPAAEVVRMEGFDAPGPRGRPAVAVMTRGSAVVRPAWLEGEDAGVVVLPDADALLGRPSYEAAEDTLRLWFAVARWTGRVVLQTRQPRHPAVQALVRWDPSGFWRQEWGRRQALRYPPAASLLRVGAPVASAPGVAAELRSALPPGDDVLGPDEAGTVLVKSARLRGTLDALTPLRHAWSKAGRGVRVDVDPVEVD